jgi:hypothetical protein
MVKDEKSLLKEAFRVKREFFSPSRNGWTREKEPKRASLAVVAAAR